MSATSGITPSADSSPMIGGSNNNGNSSHNNSFIDNSISVNKRNKNVKGSRQSGSRAPLGRIDPNAKKDSNTGHHPLKRISKADNMYKSNITTTSSSRAIDANISDSCQNRDGPDGHVQCDDSAHVKVLDHTPERGAIRGDSLSSLSTSEEELRPQSIVAASARHGECENRDPMLMDIEEATPVVDPDDSLEYEKEMQMLENFYTRGFETGIPRPHDECAE